jgi:phage portal protein BeeE
VGLRSWFSKRFSAPGIEPSGASVITTTYGMDGNEQILPSLVEASREAYVGNSVVFGAVLARAALFSEGTFCFRNLRDKSLSGSFEPDGRRNTALRKLESPWPNGSTGELLVRMMQDADIAGNAYIWNAGTRLVRLRPEWVTIVTECMFDAEGREYREVIGYFYDPPPLVGELWGGPQMFTVDEVAHWSPTPDPYAQFRGMSWMTVVLREVWADNQMTTYKTKYLENAASPNLLVKYSQKLGRGTVDRIRERIEARHGGSDNAFRTLVLDEGADVMVIGNSFEQMNFSTVQAAGENRILIASGVPGIVVGSKEGLQAATYSNYEQAMRRFADITMRPLWRSACAALSKLIAVPQGEQLWIDVSDIAALRQGEKERADTMFILAQSTSQLVAQGFKPESVVKALSSGDITLLEFDPPEPPPAPPAIESGNPADPGTPNDAPAGDDPAPETPPGRARVNGHTRGTIHA